MNWDLLYIITASFMQCSLALAVRHVLKDSFHVCGNMILLVLLTGLDSVISNLLLNVSYLGRQDPTDVLLLLGLDTMRKRSRDSVRNRRHWTWGHKTEEKPGFRPVWGSGNVGRTHTGQR